MWTEACDVDTRRRISARKCEMGDISTVWSWKELLHDVMNSHCAELLTRHGKVLCK